jgi:hypothetical protein
MKHIMMLERKESHHKGRIPNPNPRTYDNKNITHTKFIGSNLKFFKSGLFIKVEPALNEELIAVDFNDTAFVKL